MWLCSLLGVRCFAHSLSWSMDTLLYFANYAYALRFCDWQSLCVLFAVVVRIFTDRCPTVRFAPTQADRQLSTKTGMRSNPLLNFRYFSSLVHCVLFTVILLFDALSFAFETRSFDFVAVFYCARNWWRRWWSCASSWRVAHWRRFRGISAWVIMRFCRDCDVSTLRWDRNSHRGQGPCSTSIEWRRPSQRCWAAAFLAGLCIGFGVWPQQSPSSVHLLLWKWLERGSIFARSKFSLSSLCALSTRSLCAVEWFVLRL